MPVLIDPHAGVVHPDHHQPVWVLVGKRAKDDRIDDAEWCTMWFRAPAAQLVQMANKGSVAVDGVSLTLVDVEAERFSIALIPHTLDVTTLGQLKPGDVVNLETDLLAKYVEKQLAARLEK